MVDNQRMVFRLNNFDDVESAAASISDSPRRTSDVDHGERVAVAVEKAHAIAKTEI